MLILYFTGYVYCQNSIDVEDGLKKLNEQIPELPNIDTSKINVDDFEKALKEKCEKRGAGNNVELLKVCIMFTVSSCAYIFIGVG